jgi:hypothetical protein
VVEGLCVFGLFRVLPLGLFRENQLALADHERIRKLEEDHCVTQCSVESVLYLHDLDLIFQLFLLYLLPRLINRLLVTINLAPQKIKYLELHQIQHPSEVLEFLSHFHQLRNRLYQFLFHHPANERAVESAVLYDLHHLPRDLRLVQFHVVENLHQVHVEFPEFAHSLFALFCRFLFLSLEVIDEIAVVDELFECLFFAFGEFDVGLFGEKLEKLVLVFGCDVFGGIAELFHPLDEDSCDFGGVDFDSSGVQFGVSGSVLRDFPSDFEGFVDAAHK